MGRRIPITIGDREFNSVTAAVLFFRKILLLYGIGQAICMKEDLTAMFDLFMMHPSRDEKLAGQAVAGFEVNLRNYGSRCFYVVRADGSRVHFSYKCCIGLK